MMGPNRHKILERIRGYLNFMYDHSKQKFLPDQEIPLETEGVVVLLVVDETFGYLRRKIESEFPMPPGWIHFEELDREVVEPLRKG
jgi:hypothetical protein